MQLHEEFEQVESEDDTDPDSAIAVLRQQMLFYRDQAEEICEKIIEALKKNNSRGDLVAMMYKHLSDASKMTIDCAAKLAPYQSPRLESVEVKKTVTNRYVIQAPTAFNDQDLWLQNSKKELKLLEQAKREAQDIEVIENGHSN